MKPEDIAIHTLNRGDDYPFDAPNSFWNASGKPTPPQPIDWAHRAARGVLADLTDRGGVKYGFNGLPEDIRAEMVQSLALIIRIARSDPPKVDPAAPASREDCFRVAEEWNETTGALPDGGSWFYEVVGMMREAWDQGAKENPGICQQTELFKELQECRAAITALTRTLQDQALQNLLCVTGGTTSVSLPNGNKTR